MAIEYSKLKGWDVVRICELAKPVPGVDTLSFVDVHNFLTLIDNAEIMFTNSYHGTSLAISLNTNFRVVPLNNEAANTRTRCLLERLNLSEYELSGLPSPDSLQSSPNWDDVNNKINTLRKTSLMYIESICKGFLGKKDAKKNTTETE